MRFSNVEEKCVKSKTSQTAKPLFVKISCWSYIGSIKGNVAYNPLAFTSFSICFYFTKEKADAITSGEYPFRKKEKTLRIDCKSK